MACKSKISSASVWMFLIGLGGQTQIHFFGSIGISELPVYLLAPFIFVLDYKSLQRDGFMPWIWLAILSCLGCVVASWANDTHPLLMLKGLAAPYSIFAVAVVFHRLVRRDLMSYRWFLVGFFFSSIICAFVFQPETYILTNRGVAEGDEAFELMVAHPLFWTSRISAILRLPISGWYLSMPHSYSWLMVLLTGLIAVLFSDTSGRGAFAMSVAVAGLIFLGGKSRIKMARMGMHLWLLMVFGIIAAIGIKVAYRYAAESNLLGQKARDKYLKQTSRGDSLIKILMAGRKEFFISMCAAVDKPLIGHGPKAADTQGYTETFLSKYGDRDDYENYKRTYINNYLRGITYHVIPTHSYIGSFWVYYGIFGLLYWLYVLWLMWGYFRRYAASVPQWFGFQCISFFGMLWGIFFSPYGERLTAVLPIVCALFAKAIYEKKFQLPYELEIDAKMAH